MIRALTFDKAQVKRLLEHSKKSSRRVEYVDSNQVGLFIAGGAGGFAKAIFLKLNRESVKEEIERDLACIQD